MKFQSQFVLRNIKFMKIRKTNKTMNILFSINIWLLTNNLRQSAIQKGF